ncbi:MAG TPA: hypothetical protein VFV92_13855, partial [Candidatus Bathyarchaeia archaeon]|nr:hypothetical protein [Candidatus Bathyarchaeia archaeon]
MGSLLSLAASQSPDRNGNSITSFDSEAGASAIPNAATYYFQSGAESSDSLALSNTGIRGTIGVVGTNVTGCVSYWVAEEMASNNVWGQVGYFLCDTNGITPTAFYQIWNSGGVAAGGSTSVTTGLHQFSMYLSSGTTWAYAVDGTVFGTVVMNSTTSSSIYPIEALSEENYVSSPYSLPKVTFSAIQVLESGNWYSPVSGFEPNGCGSTGMSCWGVAGNIQNSTIPVDSLV